MPKRYWHFVRNDRRLGHGDGRLVVPGGVYRVPDESRAIVPCHYGMHASHDPLDTLRWAPGLVVCRVTLHGDVIEHDGDKVVAPERRVLWMADATEAAQAFAFACADRAIRTHAADALEAAGLLDHAVILRRHRVVDAESARDAALAAGSAGAAGAAWYAAGDAARAAGAAGAAWYAAGDAAWSAARAAGSDGAARAAAWSATWSATWSAQAAAWDAERAWQSRKLTRLLMALPREVAGE